MGCCHQRLEFSDSSSAKKYTQSLETLQLEKSSDEEICQKIHEYLKIGNFRKFCFLASSNSLLQGTSQFEFDPQPSTIGCLCLAILESKLKTSDPSEFSTLIRIFPILMNNLTSNDKGLVYYSYKLIESSALYLPESVVLNIVRQGLFEKLLNIRDMNTALLAHKLYKNRENIQRFFLKSKGIFIISLCLINFPEQTDEILQAALNLVAVIEK